MAAACVDANKLSVAFEPEPVVGQLADDAGHTDCPAVEVCVKTHATLVVAHEGGEVGGDGLFGWCDAPAFGSPDGLMEVDTIEIGTGKPDDGHTFADPRQLLGGEVCIVNDGVVGSEENAVAAADGDDGARNPVLAESGNLLRLDPLRDPERRCRERVIRRGQDPDGGVD